MLGKWLVSLAWPAVSRILAALGIGTLTFTGMDSMLQNAIAQAQGQFSNLAPEVLAILSIGGAVTAMSIITGGMTASLLLVVMKRFSLKSGT